MHVNSATQNQVVIRFTITEGDHSYSDALYFSQEEYSTLTESEITALQQERFNNWRKVVETPAPEPTAEEIAERVEAIARQQLDAQQQLLAMATPDRALEILDAQSALIAEQRAQIAALEAQKGA
jgi:carbamate kinase